MAKFEEIDDTTKEIFDSATDKAGLSQIGNITITVISNDKLKKIFEVKKANELLKFRSNDDVIIILNENIFQKLSLEQQNIVAEQALAYISYDGDKDKIVVTPPDFIEHSGILSKYGYDKINLLKESITTFMQVEEQREEEDKQTTNV